MSDRAALSYKPSWCIVNENGVQLSQGNGVCFGGLKTGSAGLLGFASHKKLYMVLDESNHWYEHLPTPYKNVVDALYPEFKDSPYKISLDINSIRIMSFLAWCRWLFQKHTSPEEFEAYHKFLCSALNDYQESQIIALLVTFLGQVKRGEVTREFPYGEKYFYVGSKPGNIIWGGINEHSPLDWGMFTHSTFLRFNMLAYNSGGEYFHCNEPLSKSMREENGFTKGFSRNNMGYIGFVQYPERMIEKECLFLKNSIKLLKEGKVDSNGRADVMVALNSVVEILVN